MRFVCVRFAACFLMAAASSGIAVPASGAAQTKQPAEAFATGADFSGTVDLGNGRKLFLECRGTGAPTVVFESGLRTRGDNWSRVDLLSHGGDAVLPEVAKFARACAYDRPGSTLNPGEVSRSDPAPMPRTALNVARDLHALLRAAGIPGPYVLVGHSFGGLFVRLYSALYPQEVSGLVLVDALAEQIKPLFKPSDWTTFVGLNSGPVPGFEKYAALETIDFDMSFEQMEREMGNGPMEKIPTVILVRRLPVEMPSTAPAKFASVLEPAWRKSEELLALAVPHIQYVIAKSSGHYIQLDEPSLVVKAIHDVVERAAHR